MSHTTASGSVWKQPAQVWAVAFACVVAFMGIGLVDPILPQIASDLGATETETELLFTSYLLVTGLAMFVTSWISSRIGAKPTLLIGLALIVAFSLAAAMAGSVDGVIGFRAGWGLGNALFISTALATIVGAAAGGSGAAIVLYEAALGLGIAVGPLLGGLLGSVSWRGPFFGVVALMAIAFIAITLLLRGPLAKPQAVPFLAPFRALGRPALAWLAVTAIFYNIGFFVLLAYSPFPLGFDAMGLGVTFFGWGLALAIASVWLAPVLVARFGRVRLMLVALPALAVLLVLAGILVDLPAALVACIVSGGLLLGVMNTVLTEAVMEATDLPRAVASSAYSGVRFLGAAAAPPVATLLAHAFTPTVPYLFAALSVLLAAAALVLGRRALAHIDAIPETPADAATAALVGDAV